MGADAVKANNFAYTALTSAIFSGQAPVVELIVTKTKIDVNAAGLSGNTPLSWACHFGNIALVEYFLNTNADYTRKNADGLTPLQLAIRSGHRDIVNLLRSRGAQA